jgi:hypothetical protein
MLIIAASISNIYLFGYDFAKKKCRVFENLKVNSDVGSYLSVMQMVRHLNVEDEESSEESEKISILVGTVTGKIEIFKL